MKKTLFTLLPLAELMAVVALLYGCSNLNARLAKEVNGVWQSTPEAFNDNMAISGSIVDTYEFGQAGLTATESITGPLTISGMVNVTTQVVSDSVGVQPTGLSASAHTTVSGTWTVIDEDEISISLDLNSLSVVVDPEAVTVNMNTFGASEPQLDSIRPAMVASIEAGIKQALTQRYGAINHFEDVKVKGNLLKYEINDEDFALTRQSVAE
ncbi:MAG: hypothetical protein HDR97_08420 [Bacteroides sp.]|nr:hypothetical protein [Bacteroides sp.]